MKFERVIARVLGEKHEPVLGPIISSIGPEGSHDLAAWNSLTDSAVRIGGPKVFGESHSFVPKNSSEAIDARNKRSEGYLYCTGIAAVGVDAASGRNISFLTHQDTVDVTGRTDREEKFEDGLRELLQKFRARIRPGTGDVTIYGGRWEEDPEALYSASYRAVIEKIGGIVQETLGVDPYVAIGPNMSENSFEQVDVILDTEHRRLYIKRPDQSTAPHTRNNVGFRASQLPELEKEWNIKHAA